MVSRNFGTVFERQMLAVDSLESLLHSGDTRHESAITAHSSAQ
jgi:hypothetical protein